MLAIPDSGLLLESSDSRDLPLQAFGITLNDSVIEDMIRCVQNGQGIELHLGNGPVSSIFWLFFPRHPQRQRIVAARLNTSGQAPMRNNSRQSPSRCLNHHHTGANTRYAFLPL
jgi:hypothetical protein